MTSPSSSALTKFGQVCASSWLCVRRPAFLVPAFVAVCLFALTMVVGIFVSAGQPGGSRVTDPPTLLADLARPEALATLAGGMVSVIGSCVLAIGAAHIASFFGNGTIRIQLVRMPHRRIWMLGHLAVVAVLSAVLTVVAVVAVVLTALVLAAVYRVPTGQWSSAQALGDLAVTTANLAGSMVGFALLGALVAVILRSAIAAIGAGLVYALFEQLLVGLLGRAARFLPAENLSALATGGNDRTPYGWAVCGSLLVVATSVAIAIEIVRRRDVLD